MAHEAPRSATVRFLSPWRRPKVAVAAAVGLAVLLLGGVPSRSAEPLFRKANAHRATSSREARASALRSLPLDRFDEDARAKIESVLADVTLFRRMPIQVARCDPDLYLFLVRHPDVMVNIWEVLKLSKLEMEQEGPNIYRVKDNAGTVGKVEFLYQSADLHVIYCEGSYDGPLVAKPVRGRSLMILKSGYVIEPDGRYYVASRLDAFMRVDHGGIELLTKTFHPLVGKIADINFCQTIGFVGSLSKTAEVNPKGMRRLAGRLTKVAPQVRRQFASLSDRVAEKAATAPAEPEIETAEVVRRVPSIELK